MTPRCNLSSKGVTNATRQGQSQVLGNFAHGVWPVFTRLPPERESRSRTRRCRVNMCRAFKGAAGLICDTTRSRSQWRISLRVG